MNLEVRRILLGFAWGAGLGAYISKVITTKRVEALLDERVNDVLDYEIYKIREVYDAKYKEGKFATPASTAAELLVEDGDISSDDLVEGAIKADELIRTAEYNLENSNFSPRMGTGRPDPIEMEQIMSQRVEGGVEIDPDEMDRFDVEYVEPEDVWPNVQFDEPDTDAPKSPRRFEDTIRPQNGSEVPYVISVDEFLDSNDHDKVSLTYYDGEDTQVLADERDAVITKITPLLGDDFLVRFGERSGDKNIVYIRNERLEKDIEVVLNERSYAEVVQGIKPHKSRGRKFSEDD